ncbi:MAG: hypothetical protein DIU79_03455 [Actinobacteria bacterium]|nr:MAG: hypothetical protein DIU79_03455 [Actinomycetota bacterium]
MAQRTSGRGTATATRRREQRDNHTPITPSIDESELFRLTVNELRSELRERGVNGYSGLRKDELVKKLVNALREGDGSKSGGRKVEGKKPDGSRIGAKSSRSLRYAQRINSPDEHPERPGRSLVTTNHDVIRQWAEARGASPATAGAERGRPSVLRFDFPGYNGGRLRPVSWEDWFRTFDERGLNFIYQEQKTDGRQSNFFRIESPEREDA